MVPCYTSLQGAKQVKVRNKHPQQCESAGRLKVLAAAHAFAHMITVSAPGLYMGWWCSISVQEQDRAELVLVYQHSKAWLRFTCALIQNTSTKTGALHVGHSQERREDISKATKHSLMFLR